MLESSIRVLRERWGLVLVALFAGLATGLGAFLAYPPTQQSKAAVLFVPSVKQPGVEGATNPLLELGGSVGVVASVLQIAVTADETVLALDEGGHTAKYEVLPDVSENAGPVLLVTAEDTDAATAEGTRDAVVAEISNRLTELQNARNVDPDLRVSTVLLTSAPTPEIVRKKQVQVSVATGCTTTAAILLLVLIRERRRNHPGVRDASPGEWTPRRRCDGRPIVAPEQPPQPKGVLTGSTRRTV